MDQSREYRHLKIIIFVFYILVTDMAIAQKYNFINYSVEQGLAQAQAFNIAQDKYGMLWVATLSGLSRFDGSVFHNYDKADGLLSQPIFRIFIDKKNKAWIGTENGIQSFNGREFIKYPLPAGAGSNTIGDINEDSGNQVYFITQRGKLCKIEKGGSGLVEFDRLNYLVTALGTDREKNLFVSVYNDGIYKLENGKLELFAKDNFPDPKVVIQRIFFDDKNVLWLLSNKGIYQVENGSLKRNTILPAAIYFSIEQDVNGDIWVGTSKGVYTISRQNEVKYIGAASGLTDNSVYDIIKDREGNMWFATDGEGVFKLADNAFTYIDKTSGLMGNVIMAIVADDQKNFWIGSSDGGLTKFDGKTFTKYSLPSVRTEAQKINCLLFDKESVLWIGTIGGGLWKMKNSVISEVKEGFGRLNDIVSLHQDVQERVWITTINGVFYSENNVIHKINGPDQSYFSVCDLTKDSILVGTSSGLAVLKSEEYIPFNIPCLNNNIVGCISLWNKYIITGGIETGLVFWDRVTKTAYQCTTREGLSSNNVFSIYIDPGKSIWVGTGHGLSKIEFDLDKKLFHVKNFPFLNSPLAPECNLNAIAKDARGRIWFGTTKGIAIYNDSNRANIKNKPLIYLKSVQIFSKDVTGITNDTIVAWNKIPVQLKLNHNQNHLTFEFTGIYLTDPAKIRYYYKLEGIDTAYSEPASVPMVIYSNLSPGQYVFKAYAVSDDQVHSLNEIRFPFEIEFPFYQKNWFKITGTLFLVGIGILIQLTISIIRKKKITMISQIRSQEQLKIQQKTSEDLHDDLGNKITRISVLTNILQNKIDKKDAEKQKLLVQIKENVQALYLGTKDIIWSFMPESNNLAAMLDRIQAFGMLLFEDTGFEFSVDGLRRENKQIKLPVEVSRNLILILKEALNNILKHSQGTNAQISVGWENEVHDKGSLFLNLTVSDNGKGIDDANKAMGSGLENIRKRLERIHGDFKINSTKNMGTVLMIRVKIPSKEG